MGLSGLAWYPSCPITSGKLPSCGLQCTLWFIYLCVGHLSAVFTTFHDHLCTTEVSSASLLLSVRIVTTSTNIERQPLPTVSRVSNIHNSFSWLQRNVVVNRGVENMDVSGYFSHKCRHFRMVATINRVETCYSALEGVHAFCSSSEHAEVCIFSNSRL